MQVRRDSFGGVVGGSTRFALGLRVATAALVSVVAASLLWPALGAAAPVSEGALTSGKAVNGVVSSAGGVAYTFTAVAGKHVTLAITSPHVEPSGDSLQMQVYDSGEATDASGVYINTSPTEIDFTPTAAQVGTTTVVISPYNAGATGSFTLTYAEDTTGELNSGVPVNGAIENGGEHAAYTFTAVAGQHVTLAISSPHVEPSGDSLQMQVYDSSGGTDASGVYINTGTTEIDFTPTAAQAGATTVVISAYNFETLGSFTLTYARDVTGELTPGVPTTGALLYGGQHADYAFIAVAGQAVKLAVSNPHVEPSGNSLQMQVYDASGGTDANGAYVGTGPAEIAFTPTAAQAGATTVVISPYSFETLGSFTLTLTNGSLPSGAPGPAAPPRPEPAPRPRKIGPGIGLATALGLPAAKECYSRRAFAIHVRQPHGYARIVSAEVFLGSRHERTLNKKGLSREVVLHGLPRGKFTIRIVARTTSGRTLTATRTYRTCPS
jgi:hypothetical protein